MSTIVCQTLVSCFESHLTETTTTLKLKVAAPPQPTAADRDFGNWGNFAPEITGDAIIDYNKKNYTSSFSKLSPKSLELCTENLGSETGTDILSDDGGIFPSPPAISNSGDFDFPAAGGNENLERRSRYKHHHACRKINNFPPPLTSSNSLQVRHHREGGRLIIEAVEAPFRNSYLTAERSRGRLRLCFLTPAGSGAAEIINDEEEQIGEEINDADVEPSSTDDTDVGPASVNDVEFDDEINLEMEMEMEMEKEKLKRVSRCKEGSHGGSKGLCSNWKPALWVATS